MRRYIPISWKVRFVKENLEVFNEAFYSDSYDEAKAARKKLVELAIKGLNYSKKTVSTDILRSLHAIEYWLKNPKRIAYINSKENCMKVWIDWRTIKFSSLNS